MRAAVFNSSIWSELVWKSIIFHHPKIWIGSLIGIHGGEL